MAQEGSAPFCTFPGVYNYFTIKKLNIMFSKTSVIVKRKQKTECRRISRKKYGSARELDGAWTAA